MNLAIEWASHGIQVHAIGPGYIDTDLNRTLVRIGNPTPGSRRDVRKEDWGTSEDVAWPIVFLSSQASGFITGR